MNALRAHPDWVEIVMRSKFFDFAHVLFGKPVPTVPEHALETRYGGMRGSRPGLRLRLRDGSARATILAAPPG